MTDTQIMQNQLREAVHQNETLTKDGLLERLFSRLFHGLVYPQIWEDPVVDMKALEIGENDNLVCIASGGCNMMSYLSAKPASIVAVDLSPAHIALNKLKLSAAQNLPSYESFYRFFARADHAENIAMFDSYLVDRLDPATRDYWTSRTVSGRRISMFARGFYRYGLLGRFIGFVHIIAKLGRVNFKPLLAARTMEEQGQFFDEKIAPLFDMRLVKFLARQRASLFGLGIPPAQYDKLAADGGGDVIPVLRERVRKLMCDFPIQDNFYAWQAFNRAYEDRASASVPPYLKMLNFEAVRSAAGRVRVLNQSLTDMLAQEPSGSKQCFTLLDAQDWMTDDQLNALWGEITRTSEKGARVIFRTGGADDILPNRVKADILERWTYDAEASSEGFKTDRSAIYGGFHLYRFKG